MLTEDNEDELIDSPPDLTEIGSNAVVKHLQVKSLVKYEYNYKKFMDWKLQNNATSFSESIILSYFEDLSKNMKPSTLWANYSMLKNTLSTKHNVDLNKYFKVRNYLRRQSVGFKSRKTKCLSSNQINEFIKTAPDEKYLFTKVGLIFGIMGSCRRDELQKIKFHDIEDLGSVLLVKVHCLNTTRSFIITGEYYKICKKYMSLRPPLMADNDRFFVNYQNGKCIQQFVGINKLGSLPKEIAKYLKLPNPESYTGHCFRKSSANILVDAVGDLVTLKKHGRWKSNAVAEACVDNFIMTEGKSSKLNTVEIPSTSKSLPEILPKIEEVFVINEFEKPAIGKNVDSNSTNIHNNVQKKHQIIREIPKSDFGNKIVNQNEQFLSQVNNRSSCINQQPVPGSTQMKQGNQKFKKRRIVDLIFFLEQIKNLASHNELNNCNFKHLTPTTEIYNGLQSTIVFKCNNCHKLFPINLIDSDKNELNDSLVSVAETTYLQYKGLKKICEVVDFPVMSEIQYENIKNDLEQNDVNDSNVNTKKVNHSSIRTGNINDSYNFQENVNNTYKFQGNSNDSYSQQNVHEVNNITLKSLLIPSESTISSDKTSRNNKINNKKCNNKVVNNRQEIEKDKNVSRKKRKCDILVDELIIKKEIIDEKDDYQNEYETNPEVFRNKRICDEENDTYMDRNVGTNELENQQSSRISVTNENEYFNEQMDIDFIKEEESFEEIVIKEEKFDT